MTRQTPPLDPYELIIKGCRILSIPLADSAAKKDDPSYGSLKDLGNQNQLDCNQRSMRNGDSSFFRLLDRIQGNSIGFRIAHSGHWERRRLPGAGASYGR